MRKLVCGAGTALLVLAACNYDEGPCWIDEGAGSDGAGAGPIVPGVGGYGDVPPDPQDADESNGACNAPQEQPEELAQIWCDKPSRGVECMGRCAPAGVNCPGAVSHTKTGELALLYKCCACKDDQQCWYVTETEGVCVFRPPQPVSTRMCL